MLVFEKMNENCEESSGLFFTNVLNVYIKTASTCTQYKSKNNSFNKDSSFLHMDKSDANKSLCSVTGLTFFQIFNVLSKTLS